jgi:hypothetical protein
VASNLVQDKDEWAACRMGDKLGCCLPYGACIQRMHVFYQSILMVSTGLGGGPGRG